MKLTIEIDLDNAAFELDPIEEARRAINAALDRMPPRDTTQNIYDINGNKCGQARILSDLEESRTRRALVELARLVDEAQKHPNNYENFEAMHAAIRLALLTA